MNYEICFISPYQELTSLIKDMMPKFPEKALLEEGAIKNAEPVVKDAEKKGVEVIITTEGNKRHLEEITDLPIVAFPINTFDTVYAINKAKKIFGEPLALFEFRNPNSRFHEIKEIIGAKIEQQIYRDEKDGLNRLIDVMDRGI